MVSDVNINSALSQQASTQGATASLAEDFSQFLTLLTIQLQNQDPLDPLDTAEFTNQLVAFTGVEQQINTNQRLDSLVALNLGNAVGSAINYVGQDVSYVSNEFFFDGGSQPEITYALNSEAADSTIRIFDERGTEVFEGSAGNSVGQHQFTWDGILPDGSAAPAGTYSVQIAALDAQDEAITSTVVVNGNVRGVETQGGQIFLLVGERAVALSNVLNTSTPGASLNSGGNALTAALSYVGLDVDYENSEVEYDGTSNADILYTLPDDADRAEISIRDVAGNLIYSSNVPTTRGQHLFSWNGLTNNDVQANPGTYSFEIRALDFDNNLISASSPASGTVTGVESENGQIFLNIDPNNGASTSININDILSARAQSSTS